MERLKGFINISKVKFITRKDFMIIRKGFANRLKVYMEKLKGLINISKGKFNARKDFTTRLKEKLL